MDVIGPSATGGSGTLQDAYNAGVAGVEQSIVLGSGGRLGVAIRDAAAPVAGNLFEVTDNAGAAEYLSVTSTVVSTSGRVRTADGTAALPAYSFTSDPDTGMYDIGANQLGFATAGLVRVRMTGTEFFYTQTATAAGTPDDVEFVFAAHTNVTASTEVIDLNINNARTVTWNTGPLALQRSVSVKQPTWDFNAASTLTRGVAMDIAGAPNAGANATITDLRGLSIGGAVTAGPSAAATTYAAEAIQAHTVTYTNTTAQTGVGTGSVSSLRLNQVTVAQNTGAGTLTVASAATLFIAGPVLAGTGSAVTEALSILSATGQSRLNHSDGAAAATLVPLILSHTSSIATTAGVGVGIDFVVPNGAGPPGTPVTAARIVGMLSNVTAAGEQGTLLFQTMVGGVPNANVGHWRGTSFFSANSLGIGTLSATGVSTTQFSISSSGVNWVYLNNLNSVGGHLFSGTANNSGARPFFTITPSANTATTLSTEVNKFTYTAYTNSWATGALTTQREILWNAPTYAFTAASTITTAATMAITSCPVAGGNATITNSVGLLVGGAVSIGATAAGMTYSTVSVPAHTVTVTGATGVTSACGFAAVRLDQITVSDGSAMTVTTAATLYIAAAPVGGGAGPTTITNNYAIFVDAGLCRFDGDGTNVFEIDADTTAPGAASGRIPFKDTSTGVTRFIMVSDT